MAIYPKYETGSHLEVPIPQSLMQTVEFAKKNFFPFYRIASFVGVDFSFDGN